jgi:beta-lactamase regulating signal transducer with metallopeptidase domain
MMLRHEQEHLAAGDQRLSLFGLAIVALMPWNPALWYMAHRARMAIELDCDQRVVGSGAVDLRSYGALLIAVGRRRMAAPLGSAAFSRPRSSLARRIDHMTLPARRHPRWRSILAGAGLAMVLLAAWMLPQPVRAREVSNTFEPCPERLEPTGTGAWSMPESALLSPAVPRSST